MKMHLEKESRHMSMVMCTSIGTMSKVSLEFVVPGTCSQTLIFSSLFLFLQQEYPTPPNTQRFIQKHCRTSGAKCMS